jgi:TM2 domain-containing membrane protein YozV
MPIEVKCPSCERGLRVPDKVAGKRIKCPKCSGVVEVPAETPAAPAADTTWQVKTEEGDTYGPISRSELNEWHKEGRITSETQLLEEGSDQWQWATDVYSDLDEEAAAASSSSGASPSAAPASDNPFAFAGADDSKSVANRGARKTKTKAKKKATPSKNAVATPHAPAKECKRGTAGLLSIYFGGLGLGRFYMGHKGIAIAQLLITNLSIATLSIDTIIWGHNDGIRILTKGINEDGYGRPLVD